MLSLEARLGGGGLICYHILANTEQVRTHEPITYV